MPKYYQSCLMRLLLVGMAFLLVACVSGTSNQPGTTATANQTGTTSTPTATSVPAQEQFVIYTSGAKNLPDTINALRAGDGTFLWHYTTAGGAVRGLKIVNGVLYVGTYNGNVYAFRLSDGKLLWQARFDGMLQWLDVADGVVYLNTNAYATPAQPVRPFVALYALQAANGSILWQRHLLTEFPAGVYASSTAVLSNGVIYAILNTRTPPHVISFNFEVSAFSSNDGHTLWNSSLPGSPTQLAPLVANGVVYVSAQYAQQTSNQVPYVAVLYALQSSIGTPLWNYQDNSLSSLNPQLASNGVLYAEGSAVSNPGSVESDYVLALRTSDGRQLWRDQLTDANAGSGSNFSTSITVLNNALYVAEMEEAPGGGTGKVLALQASDGKFIWRDDIAHIGITEVQVLVAGDRVYVGQNERIVSALRTDTGAVLWQHTFGDSESGVFKLAVSKDIVYVGTYPDTGSGRSLCAIQATNGTQLWCHQADAGVILMYVSQ
ncbi:MAG: hypothetical protein NVS4B7_11970 [Ktedonobacteraceae bacterium]